MCIILDTNTFHRFMNSDDMDMEPVRKWLNGRYGKIAYSATPKLKKEWDAGGMRRLIEEWKRAGKLKLVPSDEHHEKEAELKGKTKSDDEHIVALALVAKVKVLVSYREGDSALFDDFKNRHLVGGKVYTRKTHAHLLPKDTCP